VETPSRRVAGDLPGSSIGAGRVFLAATQSLLWPLYLVWSGCLVAVWTLGIGEVELQSAVAHPDLRAALQAVLRLIDPLWITLGFYHIYGALVLQAGISRARRWIGAGLLVCVLISWISSSTSWPLGPVHFTERLGKRFGPVPLCLPLLWLTLFLGARATAARLLSGALPKAVPALTAALACASGLLIDPVAWKQRSWWLWYPADVHAPAAAPWTAPVTFFAASYLAATVMRGSARAIAPRRETSIPIVVFAVVQAAFLAPRLFAAFR
jgi:hypothetical protein